MVESRDEDLAMAENIEASAEHQSFTGEEEEKATDLSSKSVPIEDPALVRLYNWVSVNGGIF